MFQPLTHHSLWKVPELFSTRETKGSEGSLSGTRILGRLPPVVMCDVFFALSSVLTFCVWVGFVFVLLSLYVCKCVGLGGLFIWLITAHVWICIIWIWNVAEIKELIFMLVLYTLSNNLCFWVASLLSHGCECVYECAVLLLHISILKFGLALSNFYWVTTVLLKRWGSPATHLFSPIPEGLNT